MFHRFPAEAFGSGVLVRSLDLSHAPVSVNGIGQAAALVLTGAEQAGYVRRAGGDYSRKAIPPLAFEYQPIGWDMSVHTVPAEALPDAPAGLSHPWPARSISMAKASRASSVKPARAGSTSTTAAPTRSAARRASNAPARSRRGPTSPAWPTRPCPIEDLDASGEKQVATFVPQLGGYFALGRDKWQPFRAFAESTNIDFRDPGVRRIDLTGDGRLSILLTQDDAFVWHAAKGREGFAAAERVLRALDEEPGPVVVFAEAQQTVFLADMSGDGLTDIVRIRNGEISYWPNLGYGRFGARWR